MGLLKKESKTTFHRDSKGNVIKTVRAGDLLKDTDRIWTLEKEYKRKQRATKRAKRKKQYRKAKKTAKKVGAWFDRNIADSNEMNRRMRKL